MSTSKHAEQQAAFARGARIQIWCATHNEWETIGDRGDRGRPGEKPSWDEDNEYRVHPDDVILGPAGDLQPYELQDPASVYSLSAVRSILYDAHLHHAAQVRQFGGLARTDVVDKQPAGDAARRSPENPPKQCDAEACETGCACPGDCIASGRAVGDAEMPVDCWRTPEWSAWSHEQGAHGRGTACTVALVTLADAQAALEAAEKRAANAEHDLIVRKNRDHATAARWDEHMRANAAALAAKDAQHRDLLAQWTGIMQACIAAMPAGHMSQHAAAEHPCGNPLPAAVAALTGRIAGLEADLVEERNRIASMRKEHCDEVSYLLERDKSLRARLDSLTLESGARIAELEESAKVLVAVLHDAQNGLTTPDVPNPRPWQARKLADMGGAGVTITLEQPAAVDWSDAPAPEAGFHIASVNYEPAPGALDWSGPSIDAANLAPAAETFMHAAPDAAWVTKMARLEDEAGDAATMGAGVGGSTLDDIVGGQRDAAAMMAEHMRLVRVAVNRVHAGWSLDTMSDAMAAVEASAKRMLGIE